jgi:hypothetical protein
MAVDQLPERQAARHAVTILSLFNKGTVFLGFANSKLLVGRFVSTAIHRAVPSA